MPMQLNRILKATALGTLLAVVVTGPVHAVDGVIEINQVRAKAGGVTPGDTPLFPVTISQPGSYRLTGNLDVTDASARPGGMAAEDTTAILVTADDVTVDLNGFMIKGPTTCSGSPFMCSPTGSGRGIDGSGMSVSAMNGTVRGMGRNGLSLGAGSRAEKIHAVSNGSSGIFADTVANCIAIDNGGIGVGAVTVTNCWAKGNDTGVSGNTVSGCQATANRLTGIAASFLATGCTAFANGTTQIAAPGIVGHNMCGSPAMPCP